MNKGFEVLYHARRRWRPKCKLSACSDQVTQRTRAGVKKSNDFTILHRQTWWPEAMGPAQGGN